MKKCDAARHQAIEKRLRKFIDFPGEILVRGAHPEISYSIYKDGSLWFYSNAEGQIWDDANDFLMRFSDEDDEDLKSILLARWRFRSVGDIGY